MDRVQGIGRGETEIFVDNINTKIMITTTDKKRGLFIDRLLIQNY